MSQEAVARAAGVTVGMVGKWEHSKANPKPDNIFKLSSLFGVDPGELGFEAPTEYAPQAPAWAQRLESKIDALIAFHRSGGNPDHLEGL